MIGFYMARCSSIARGVPRGGEELKKFLELLLKGLGKKELKNVELNFSGRGRGMASDTEGRIQPDVPGFTPAKFLVSTITPGNYWR
jgi:hypothetical protein